MINLRHVEVFYAIMRAGSITEAARVLNVTQPALTKSLRQLEEELSDLLGTRVEILSRSKGSGKLVVHFSSLDQLDSILTRLR